MIVQFGRRLQQQRPTVTPTPAPSPPAPVSGIGPGGGPQGWRWDDTYQAFVPGTYSPGTKIDNPAHIWTPPADYLKGALPVGGTYGTEHWPTPEGPGPTPTQPSKPTLAGYTAMPGFDYGRIQNLSEQDPKYLFARAIQQLGVQQAPTEENLQRVLEELLKQGLNVTRSGDVLSFNTGNKFGTDVPQDVIRDIGGPNAQWQFLNAGGAGGPEAPGGGPAAGLPAGSSPTDYVNQALASGISQSAIDQFLASNPGDYGRLQSALNTTLPGTNAGPLPGSDLSDPAGNFFSNLINAQLGNLLAPRQNPAAQQYANLMQRLIDQLGQPAPLNEDLKSYLDYARAQFGQLQQAPFSGQDLAIINQQQIGPIEQDRAAAKQNLINQLGARGITPESGVFQSALQQLDATYDKLRAEAYTGTSLAAINQRYANQQSALNLGQNLTSLNQLQQDLALQRQMQGLQVAGGLNTLGNQIYGQEQERANQALSLARVLEQLPIERLQQVQSVVSGGQAPAGGLVSSILSLLGQQQQQANRQQDISLAQQEALYNGLGQILEQVLNG